MPAPPSTVSRTGPDERAPDTTQAVEDPRCDVCPHPVVHHDAIGLRFCRATLDSALVRSCVCRPA